MAGRFWSIESVLLCLNWEVFSCYRNYFVGGCFGSPYREDMRSYWRWLSVFVDGDSGTGKVSKCIDPSDPINIFLIACYL